MKFYRFLHFNLAVELKISGVHTHQKNGHFINNFAYLWSFLSISAFVSIFLCNFADKQEKYNAAMENLSHFHSLEELIRALYRERKLLHALFQDRKKLSFRYELARELASKKDESMEFLRRYGIVRENGDFVEIEDVYLKFFEDVLEVNEEINVASVKESIDNLNAAIDYYLSENNPSRKYGYLKDVKRILRNIALTTL